MVHSPFGRSLTGIRENERACTRSARRSFGRLLTIYTISAAMAGAAGALIAETTQLVALNALSFDLSGAILIMLILGGVGRLYGAFVGVPLYMIAQDRFSQIDPTYWYFWIGLLLVIVVLFAPRRHARPDRYAVAAAAAAEAAMTRGRRSRRAPCARISARSRSPARSISASSPARGTR